MDVHLTGPVKDVKEISTAEFNKLKINSIGWLYPKERSESKAPTFALT